MSEKPKTQKIYCGAKPPRKSQVRGTAKQCAQANQVRYYGLEKVEPSDIVKAKKEVDINKETHKLNLMLVKIKRIASDAREQAIIRDHPDSPKKKKDAAAKKIDKMIEQAKKLQEQYKQQKAYVESLQKEVKGGCSCK